MYFLCKNKQTKECFVPVVVVVAFSSWARFFWRMFDYSFPAYTFFFFKVEISLRTLIPLFMPGLVHRGSASWDGSWQSVPCLVHVFSALLLLCSCTHGDLLPNSAVLCSCYFFDTFWNVSVHTQMVIKVGHHRCAVLLILGQKLLWDTKAYNANLMLKPEKCWICFQ